MEFLYGLVVILLLIHVWTLREHRLEREDYRDAAMARDYPQLAYGRVIKQQRVPTPQDHRGIRSPTPDPLKKEDKFDGQTEGQIEDFITSDPHKQPGLV